METMKNLVPRSSLRGRLVVALFSSLLLLGLLAAQPVHATPRCTVGTAAYPTIQSAVNDSICRSISVPAGTFHENVSISRDVKIRGEGADVTIVDGNSSGIVFAINNGSVLLGDMTIQNGGNGIQNAGTLTVKNSTISGNTGSEHGGGIANLGTLTVQNSTISHNKATRGGGLGFVQK